MKDLLIKYYNLNEEINVLEEDDKCSFVFHEKKYLFVSFNRNENEFNDLLDLTKELWDKKIPTSRFILNRNNEYITNDSLKKYVLLEFPLDNDKEYNILDMIEFDNILHVKSTKSILYRNTWSDLWSSKIDYFEYQVAQLGKNKPLILNSFSYYVGLAENAISYVNNTLKNYKISIYENICLQRKRIFFPNNQLNYFNPLNYVIDLNVRDVASYFKSLFFNSYDDLWIEVKAFLKRKRLSIYGYQLLYARLLYPSYYFDIYEKVMDDSLSEKELYKVINKTNEYEMFLKRIYFEIVKYAPIEPIEWIVNKRES